jgi:hypothetical protein
MTLQHDNSDPVSLDDRLIDRLVDGALADADRRKVLARLDIESGGWRRCALAFLEAQSWREALGPAAAAKRLVSVQPVRRPEAAEGRLPVRRRAGSFAAIAAGLVAAFALGWSARGVAPGEPAGGSIKSAETRPAGPVVAPAVPATRPAAAQPDTVATRTPTAAPLPEPLVRAWEQRGYEVAQSQRLVSMELKNGRRVAVPIDEVRLRFVGHRTY